MKQDKNLLYNNRILNCLLNEKIYTTLEIASKVGLSEKTVRTRLNEINGWMEQNGFGKIQKRQGAGIWLECSEEERQNLEKYLDGNGSLPCEFSMNDSKKQLIGTLLKLKPGEITTLQYIADSLYLSSPTVGKLLREVSCWFEERGLKIVSMRRKGFCLEGSEYSFRIAIRDYMLIYGIFKKNPVIGK